MSVGWDTHILDCEICNRIGTEAVAYSTSVQEPVDFNNDPNAVEKLQSNLERMKQLEPMFLTPSDYDHWIEFGGATVFAGIRLERQSRA